MPLFLFHRRSVARVVFPCFAVFHLFLASLGATPAGPGFNPPHGFKTAPFNLTLTPPAPGGSLYYSLDGSEPTAESGISYQGPIPISRTSVVRAVWVSPEGETSFSETRTYLFLNDIVAQSPNGAAPQGWPESWGQNVADYGMDPRITQESPTNQQIRTGLTAIPSLSLVLPLNALFDVQTGIYANPYQKGREWERAASVELIDPRGGAGFSARGGLRIKGSASRSGSNPKHSLRVYFRESYGQPVLSYPLFGPTGAPTCKKFDLRCDQIASWHLSANTLCDFIRDQWARDTMLEMGQPADRGDFYHLYINGLYWGIYNTLERHDADYGAQYFGGDNEDYDVVRYDNDVYNTAATDGTLGAWRRLHAMAVKGFESVEAYQRVQGNNPDGRRNPAYERLVDVDNLIDYMLLGIYFVAFDSAPYNGSQNNWATIRSRKQNFGFRSFPVDWELGMQSVTQGIVGLPQPQLIRMLTPEDSNPYHIWEALRENPQFRQRVAERVQLHFFNQGSLTPQKAAARYQARMDEINLAVVAESARWGDFAINSGAPPFIQFPPTSDNPSFPPVRPGLLTREDWLKATAYYINTFFPQRTNVVLDQLRSVELYPGTGTPTPNPPPEKLPGLEITEIHYHSAPSGTVLEDEAEFLELKNTSTTPIALGGLQFTSGISFEFPSNTSLAPGAFYLLGRNPAAFSTRYPGKNLNGTYTGRLSNQGEEIELSTSTGSPLLSVTYNTSGAWPVMPDGLGFSLVYSGSGDPDKGRNWRPSTLPGGSPGADDPAPPEFPRVVIQSLNPRPNSGSDTVTLQNIGKEPADISGWWLSNVPENPKVTRLAAGSILAPGALLTVNFPVSERGGKVLLSSASTNGTLTGYGHRFSYGPCASNDQWIRRLDSTGEEHFTGPNPTGIQINEVHYHGADAVEFVELLNRGTESVNVSGWSLGGLPFTFPPNTVLLPNGILVVCTQLPETFRASYNLPPGSLIFGPAPAGLPDSGGEVTLLQPLAFGAETLSRILETVPYEDSAPWPYSADGYGGSLQRAGGNTRAAEPVSWVGAPPSPGLPNPVNAPPLVSLISPSKNAGVTPGQQYTLVAEASDLDGTLKEVRFYANALQIGSAQNPPYSMIWTASSDKVTDFTVEAEDNSGNVTSTPVTPVYFDSEDTEDAFPAQTGLGLRASYFANQNLEGSPVERIESALEQNWSDIDPIPGQISRNSFSLRWEGAFLPSASGSVSFQISAAGKLRVWINDALALDVWDSPSDSSFPLGFQGNAGNPVTLKIEFANAPPLLPRLKLSSSPVPPAGIPASRSFYLPTQTPLGFDFLTPPLLPSATAAKPYFRTLLAIRGSGDVSYSATGLPAGLSLSSTGVLSGTPRTTGSNLITVQATDSAGITISRTFQLRVLPGRLPASPTLSISTPANNASFVSQTVPLSGTAKSGLGISRVEYQLNEQPWRSVQLSGSATGRKFSLPLDSLRGLSVGTNLLLIRALDEEGRRVQLPVRKFFWNPNTPFLVQTEGLGSVTRGFRGQTLRPLGRILSIAATPGRGHLFAGWRTEQDTVLSMSPSLKFLFNDPAQTLTAVFVPTPFTESAGLYLGQFESPEMAPEKTGDFQLQLNSMGGFTGRLRLGLRSLPFKGALYPSGEFQATLSPRSNPLQLTLALDPGTRNAVVSISPQSESQPFTATLHPPASGNPPANRTSWNVTVPAAALPGQPTLPGTAKLVFSSGYRARLVGRLGDGSAWSISSVLLNSAKLPLFCPLYGNRGFISGPLSFSDSSNTASGTFLWLRPSIPRTPFPAGFLFSTESTALLQE